MSLKRTTAYSLSDGIKNEDLSSIQSLLENVSVNLDERDEDGQTYLMQACEKGSLVIVRELLLVEVDVNAVDSDGCTALMIAAKEGHLGITIELLDKGTDLESRDMCNWTALMWACYRGRSLVVQELLERGALPNLKADFSVTCLTWASGRGYADITQMLITKGAKVNSADKYGTTPVIWAARRGYLRLVDILIGEGANVDAVGMDSLTALVAATKGGYTDIVTSLMACHPNVNAMDKDGFTPLMIAAKDCHIEILHALLNHGAYVNVCDKEGESVLMHAVKGGHTEIVTALLDRFADVDQQGSDGRSALYCAVERNHTEILSVLLSNDADTEKITKDVDTALMRSVRSRNFECVQLLLKAGAKVSPTDKKGDTALHIAVRSRSKRITELLLQNPQNSRLLYKPNRMSESPYSIDTHYQKGILSQIFGHRNLNANDGENLLGYEIYSSTLADILSEPSLNTPIIVGLYAKWGSGKSFLLSKLQVEMKNFMHSVYHKRFSPTLLSFLLCFTINLLTAYIICLSLNSWHAGGVKRVVRWEVPAGVGLGLFLPQYAFMLAVWAGGVKYKSDLAIRLGDRIVHYSHRLGLLLQILFCNPRPRTQTVVPFVRFLFSDYSRITSVGGEKSLTTMIGTLCESVERQYGTVVTRLARVFNSPHRGSGRFKSICCMPYFVLCLVVMVTVAAGVALLVIHRTHNSAVNGVLIAVACIVAVVILGNIYTWGQAAVALAVSQKSRVVAMADKLDTLKMEGLVQRLKHEVDALALFVATMDGFTGDQTRLVLIMDGLDSCEQDKIFYTLNTIKALFSDDRAPFITILAVDPHVIIRGLERDLKGDSHINGYDYLRNIVHLPFYLQSQGVRIQRDARSSRNHAAGDSTKVSRQESTISSSVSLNDTKHKNYWKSGQSLHTSSFDLSKTLIKDDYFSDVNPRSMRRLMNIVAVTGRLLRAYSIEFTWTRLAGWINIIEQWPYRVSWVILHWEESAHVSDSTTLLALYQQIEARIPNSREVDPLLEIDRNARKFVAFLSSHSSSYPMLSVADLQKFLPITVNLDPYLRKLIKELQNNVDHARLERNVTYPANLQYLDAPLYPQQSSPQRVARPPASPNAQQRFYPPMPPYFPIVQNPQASYFSALHNQVTLQQPMFAPQVNQSASTYRVNFKGSDDIEPLSQMNLSRVCDTLSRLDGITTDRLTEYSHIIVENNITGVVLYNCDVDELKPVMTMRFGDWQLFRAMILYLRQAENTRTPLKAAGTQSGVVTPSPRASCSGTHNPAGKATVNTSPNKQDVNAVKVAHHKTVENPRSALKRRDSQLEQMKMESHILFEVLDEFTFEENSDSGESDDKPRFFIEDEQEETKVGKVDSQHIKCMVDPLVDLTKGTKPPSKLRWTDGSDDVERADVFGRSRQSADEPTVTFKVPAKSPLPARSLLPSSPAAYPAVHTVVSTSNQTHGMYSVKPDFPHKKPPDSRRVSQIARKNSTETNEISSRISPDLKLPLKPTKHDHETLNEYPFSIAISEELELTPDWSSGDDLAVSTLPLLHVDEDLIGSQEIHKNERPESIALKNLSSKHVLPVETE